MKPDYLIDSARDYDSLTLDAKHLDYTVRSIKDYTDNDIKIAVIRAVNANNKDGLYYVKMYADEMDCLLLGALKYLDMIEPNKSDERIVDNNRLLETEL